MARTKATFPGVLISMQEQTVDSQWAPVLPMANGMAGFEFIQCKSRHCAHVMI